MNEVSATTSPQDLHLKLFGGAAALSQPSSLQHTAQTPPLPPPSPLPSVEAVAVAVVAAVQCRCHVGNGGSSGVGGGGGGGGGEGESNGSCGSGGCVNGSGSVSGAQPQRHVINSLTGLKLQNLKL